MRLKKPLFTDGLCECCLIKPQEWSVEYLEPIQLELFQEMQICTKVCFQCYNQALIAEAMKGGSIDIFA